MTSKQIRDAIENNERAETRAWDSLTGAAECISAAAYGCEERPALDAIHRALPHLCEAVGRQHVLAALRECQQGGVSTGGDG